MARKTSSGNRHYLTRIAYNSSEWRWPTGEARELEGPTTMNGIYGYGCEDWLFRSEWAIDSWCYGFIQGVNNSHARLVREGLPFDLTLYTIRPNKQWRLVADLRDVECLDFGLALEVMNVFKQRGWYRQMEKEVKKIDGDTSGFRTGLPVPEINLRYRLRNVTFFPAETHLGQKDAVRSLKRYLLYDVAKQERDPDLSARLVTRLGARDLPVARRIQRGAVDAVEYTPEHILMQAQLMKELRSEYPKAKITREQDFIDVRVETAKELILFEIKSDLSPRTVIREAIGQILEYAFHPRLTHVLPVRLVIVGRSKLSPEDMAYLMRLQRDFDLPLAYRVVTV